MSKSVMPLYARQSPLTGIVTGVARPAGFHANSETQLLRQMLLGAPPIGAVFCVNGDGGIVTK